MENNHRDLTPADLVKIYKKHKQEITYDEAEAILAFMDNMIGRVKRLCFGMIKHKVSVSR